MIKLKSLLSEKCWKGYKKDGMKTMFGKRVPNCVKNEAELEKEKFTTPDQMRMYEDEVEEGSLPIKLKDVLNVKKMKLSKDAPEAVKDFWGHHHEHPGTADGPAEPDTYDFDDDMQSDPGLQFDDSDDEEGGYEPVDENLRQWFGKGGKGSASGGGWDRYNTKGEKIGKCGDRKKGEGTPKCLSKFAAATMSKKARAAAVRKKRREDPNPNRRGKAKNVSSKPKKRSKKESVLDEKAKTKKRDACYYKVKGRYKKWPSAYASGALVQCRKKGAKNWGTGGKKK